MRCSAFLSDLSDVKDQFAYTSNKAEEGYVTHLGHHYNVVVQEQKSLLLDTMATVETQATQKEHTDMLRKTDSNVTKLWEKEKRINWTISPYPHKKGKGVTHQILGGGRRNRLPPTQTRNMVSNPNPMPLFSPEQPPLYPPMQPPPPPYSPIYSPHPHNHPYATPTPTIPISPAYG